MTPETLSDYAARVLAGTGLSAAHAPAVARGDQYHPGTAAAALCDGYSAPDRAPEPTPDPADTHDQEGQQ